MGRKEIGIWALLLVLLAGCAPPATQRPRTWMDIGDVSGRIAKPEREAAVLGAASEAVGGDVTKRPQVQDMQVETGAENPSLTGLAAAEKQPAPPAAEGEGILLNFDNADIFEFIQAMAQIIDLNYIIDPAVKGVVNIRATQKIPPDQVFQIFKKILHINGLDIRSEGDYYYIFPAQKPMGRTVYGPAEVNLLKDSPRMIIQVVPVVHLTAAQAMQLVQPYVSDRGQIFEVPNQNTLLISDFESRIIDIVQVLALLDTSPLAGLKARLVRVENAPLFDLQEELNEILNAMAPANKEQQTISVVPLERINAILLVSKQDFMISNAERWIKELDVIQAQGAQNVFVYQVRNSVASELAELVNEILMEPEEAKETSTTASRRQQTATSSRTQTSNKRDRERDKPVNPFRPGQTPSSSRDRDNETSQSSTTTSSAPVRLSSQGQPTLIADDNRNVIVIRAQQSGYTRVLKLLERLDNLPSQVLIEVLVAEVALKDNWEFGIEWFIKGSDGLNSQFGVDVAELGFKDFGTGVGDLMRGFTYGFFTDSERAFAILNAVAANSDLKVLSSPQVMVLNNESAVVNVGQEVPVVTTQTERTATEQPIFDKTIQYRDTGIILEVTPKINANGVIILDVSQEVSTADTAANVSGINSPVINKRELKTKLAVKDGQSILMGGLIQQQQDNGENGVPLLKDVPVLGNLFKFQSQRNDKTELLVMITPYVIDSENVLDQYIAEFKKKMAELRNEL